MLKTMWEELDFLRPIPNCIWQPCKCDLSKVIAKYMNMSFSF